MRPEQAPDPHAALGAPIGVERFAEAARRCAEGRRDLAIRGSAPDGRRRLRRFSAAELCRWLLPADLAELRRALREHAELPQGGPETGPPDADAAPDPRPGAQPWFDFAETLRLRAHFAAKPGAPARAAGSRPAKVVAVANFKGGVGKTSLAAHLAMAAALDGLRVLAVDLDSQGSLTSIFGARPEDEWETAYPLLARDYAQAREAAGLPLDDEALERARALPPAALIRPTHWPAIDLIGAQLNLYWAEFQIPVWRLALKSWRLWDALGHALEEAAEPYDLVIVDTPPALGYLTVNALAAADILLVPLGASFLEFDSTGRFFDMLHATFASIEEGESAAARAMGLGELRFEWDAVRCVLTRYDAAQQAEMAEVMGHWFGDLMAASRIEATALVGQAGEQTKGIYEADPRDFNRETYRRGRETFDRAWAELRGLLEAAWARDAAEAAAEAAADPSRGETPAGQGARTAREETA